MNSLFSGSPFAGKVILLKMKFVLGETKKLVREDSVLCSAGLIRLMDTSEFGGPTGGI